MMEKVTGITLTTDTWTTKKSETVMVLTGYFIDSKLTMRYNIVSIYLVGLN